MSTRHTGAAFHVSSNRVDVPPRSIPVGLPKMVDAKHRLVNHEIQLTSTRHTNSVCGHLGHQWVVLDAYTYLAVFIPRELQWFQDLCCCLLRIAQFACTVCGSQIYCLGYSSTPPLPDWHRFLLHPLPEQHHLNLRLFQLYG